MMAVAVAIALGSSLAGLYASYYLSLASGASIVLACTAFFGLAWGMRALRGSA
jgi:manganese/iron transport system permease protein